MDCDKLSDLLALHAGGETDKGERLAIEAHLSVCTQCSRELGEYRDLRSLVAGLQDGTAPAGTFEAMTKFILPERRAPIFVTNVLSWTARAAAMLIIGLSLGYSIHSISGRAFERSAAPAAAAHDDADNGGSVIPGYAREAGTGGSGSPYSYGSPYGRRAAMDGMIRKFNIRQDGTYYLPRVETLLNPDEVDF